MPNVPEAPCSSGLFEESASLSGSSEENDLEMNTAI